MPAELAPHGTPKRYQQGCRCQECRDAWAAHARTKRAERRASSAIAAASSGAVAEGEGARLTRLWAAEVPASLRAVADVLGAAADGAECPRCGGTVRWTTDHTVLVCEACPVKIGSPGAGQRAEALETERKARAERRPAGGEIAERAEVARRRRLELRANRKQVAKYLREMLETLEGARQLAEAEGNGYLEQRAEVMHDSLEGYADEIAQADTLELLGELLGELQEVRASGEVGELLVFVHQREREAERREQVAQRQAEQRRREIEAEREARQLERQRQAEQQRQIASARAGQRSFDGAQAQAQRHAAATGTLPTGTLAGSMGMLAVMIHKQRQAKERLRERNGECGWCNKTAERVYGIPAGVTDRAGNPAPHPGLPQARACKRHFGAADQWIEGQRGQLQAFYWELSA